jgi:hypothetical protein
MKIFSPLQVCAVPDELLKVTENPRHRAMIKNFRRHAMLEVSGRWKEILLPGMLVAEPVYRIYEGGQGHVLRGREQVAAFYEAFAASGATVFGPLEERMAVADWGLSLESYFGNHLRGHQLRALGIDADDPQGFYQLEHWYASFWPYDDNCLLMGEHIYENPATRVVREIDEADFVTQEMAAAALGPLIDADGAGEPGL